MKKRLGKLLLAEGLITELQLTEALEEQVVHGGRLGSILVELGHLAPENLASALSRQLGLPAVEAEELQRLLPTLPRVLSKEQLNQLLGIPLRLEGRTLHVAVIDPGNVAAVDAVQFATRFRLQLRVVAEGLFWNFAEPHLGLERPGFQRGRGNSWARSKPAPAKPAATPARRPAQLVVDRSRPVVQKPPTPQLSKPRLEPEETDGPPPLELPADLLRELRATSDLFGPASQVIGGDQPVRPGGISTRQLQALRGGPGFSGELELEPALRGGPGFSGELELEPEPAAGDSGGLELEVELDPAPGEREDAPALLVGEMLEEPAPPYVEEEAPEPEQLPDEDSLTSRTMARPLMVQELFQKAALAEEAARAKAARLAPVAQEPGPRGTLARPGFSSAPTRNVSLDAGPPPPTAAGDDDDADAPTGVFERPAPASLDDDFSSAATGVVQAAPPGTFSDEPIDRGAPPEITPLPEILGDLNAATHREEVADALRAYARGRTERMVLLYLRRDSANGFVCEGTGLSQERVVQLSVPLLEPSAFQRARETRLPYFGPPIEGSATDTFQRWLGLPVPAEVVVIPIRIDARVVNLLYLDNGAASLGTALQFEGLKLSRACAAAYERILARAREGSKA